MATSKGRAAEPKPHVKPGEALEPRGPRYKKAPKPLSNEQLALLEKAWIVEIDLGAHAAASSRNAAPMARRH